MTYAVDKSFSSGSMNLVRNLFLILCIRCTLVYRCMLVLISVTRVQHKMTKPVRKKCLQFYI